MTVPRTPSTFSSALAYTQPLDQQAGGPLLHPPSPMYPGRNPGAALAEGLRMSPVGQPSSFAHTPVLLTEVTKLFEAVPDGVVLDATVGAGGHARALLELSPSRHLVGIDRDPDAVTAARLALASYGPRATVLKARFDRLGDVLADLGISGLAGALFDLGVSSPQVDQAERGFSFRADAPLDMRMDPAQGETAAELVNSSGEEQLARLFYLHGEQRFARR